MSDTPDEFRRRLTTPEYAVIPESTRNTLYLYYAYRCRPGYGTRALLEKNISAVVMVDEKVLVALPAMFRLMHNNAEDACWGSKSAVAAWIQGVTPSPDHWPADDAVSRLGAT